MKLTFFLSAVLAYSGEMTFYDLAPGDLVSCQNQIGKLDVMASVAIAEPMLNQNGPASNCGSCIMVHGSKGSMMVKVVDLCGGCKPTDIDLSRGAFAQIANPDAGRVPDTQWEFVPCSGQSPAAPAPSAVRAPASVQGSVQAPVQAPAQPKVQAKTAAQTKAPAPKPPVTQPQPINQPPPQKQPNLLGLQNSLQSSSNLVSVNILTIVPLLLTLSGLK